MPPRRVIIVGGGITGLAAAWRIHQSFQRSHRPLDLRLLESSSTSGGALQSIERDGFLMEMGADCFITEKPRGVELCKELGLESELISTRPGFRRSYILKGGKLHPIPEGFYLLGPSRYRPFLESDLLSWPGKFRAMLEPLIFSRAKTDESLASFVKRRFGQEMLDWLAQPLLAGIYGARPEDLSLRATFPKFLEMERTYGSVSLGLKKWNAAATHAASGARYSLFNALKRGMQTLPDTLIQKLGSQVIQTNSSVKEIRRIEDTWQVVKSNGDILEADAVCLALPSYAIAPLIQRLDTDLSTELASIPYAPAATINFALRESDMTRPLNGIGFVVPSLENKLTLGCTFAHNKFEGRAPKGFLLVRAFLGGVQNTAWTHESDDVLTNNVFVELKEWLGITGSPLFTHLQRYNQALPQYNVGHLPKILWMEERMLRYKGLSLAGNWSYGVGIPDSIASGERAAELLSSHLERSTPAAL